MGLLALFAWWRLSKERVFAGQLFLVVTAVYSGGRLFVDTFRDNAWLTDSGFHILQFICLVVMLISLYLLGYLADRSTPQLDS